MKKEEKVEVIWDDAYHLTDSWLTFEEIAEAYKQERFRVTSIGWLLYEDKEYIIIGSKQSKDKRSYGFVMMIPKGMIIKTKVIK